MRRAVLRCVGLAMIGALMGTAVPALAAEPAPLAARAVASADPAASPTPVATASATPAPTPSPGSSATPTPTDSPTATPAPTEPEPHVEDEHENDGPTMPLTRELPVSARLAISLGPQPVFHFPWAPAHRWGASGSHADSDGIYRGAIDFAPLSSSDKRVLSIAAGRVYRVSCGSGWFLGIDHGGGWMSEYYHLSNAKSSLIGTWVEAGTPLGNAGQTLPCGGTPGSTPHVHLSILHTGTSVPDGKRPYIAVDGIQFENYILRDSSGAYDGAWRDFAGQLILRSNGVSCCLWSTSRVGPSSPKAVRPDINGNGVDDRSEVTPWDTDLDSDGLPEVVGFGQSGVLVANNTGSMFQATVRAVSGFGPSTGWSTAQNPRMVADVSGDGTPDIVGFADHGVVVAPGNGSTFGSGQTWVDGFGHADGWRLDAHVRALADVTGDGRADVIGFGGPGVTVARSTGTSFTSPSRWLSAMGSSDSAGDWTTTRHLRLVSDVNGDGRADLVGFDETGVVVARSTGSGFSQPQRWSSSFGANRGWRTNSTPRYLVDVNGDDRPDIVGFASGGVYVALNTGSSFATASRWSSSFGPGASWGGWSVSRHPRTLADVDGDGLPDIVGFGPGGTFVARNTGSSFAGASLWTTDYGSTEWTLGLMPRSVVDVNGDGRADIVGFAKHGVHVALSDGSRFGAAAHWTDEYGWGVSTGEWRVTTKPRGVSAG